MLTAVIRVVVYAWGAGPCKGIIRQPVATQEKTRRESRRWRGPCTTSSYSGIATGGVLLAILLRHEI